MVIIKARLPFIAIASIAFLLLSTGAMCETLIIPKDRFEWWKANAPTCKAPDGYIFPSKMVGGDCDDGDINLFAGLLCASGDPIGCETVRRAQESSSGRWFRSPRRALTNNLGNKNSFSPDMALGSQLYIAKSKDKESLKKWLSWLDNARPCWIGDGDGCVRGLFLRFCTDDTEKGCTVRPGDAGILGATSKYFNVAAPSVDVQRLLEQSSTNVLDLVWASSQLNEPGYSQHLTAVEIFLLRQLGYTDAKLQAAAIALSQKQPKNPFFLYLAEGTTQKVVDLTLSLCPSPSSGLPAELSQWSWEREDKENAGKHSMLWDCIFMARLIGVSQ